MNQNMAFLGNMKTQQEAEHDIPGNMKKQQTENDIPGKHEKNNNIKLEHHIPGNMKIQQTRTTPHSSGTSLILFYLICILLLC